MCVKIVAQGPPSHEQHMGLTGALFSALKTGVDIRTLQAHTVKSGVICFIKVTKIKGHYNTF